MAIKCPKCGNQYDVALFEFGRTILCACGRRISLEHRLEIDEEDLPAREEEKIFTIKNMADRISFLIVSTDYPVIDIEIEKIKLKEKIEELFPDKTYLYDLIYEPRFRRLMEQFRSTTS